MGQEQSHDAGSEKTELTEEELQKENELVDKVAKEWPSTCEKLAIDGNNGNEVEEPEETLETVSNGNGNMLHIEEENEHSESVSGKAIVSVTPRELHDSQTRNCLVVNSPDLFNSFTEGMYIIKVSGEAEQPPPDSDMVDEFLLVECNRADPSSPRAANSSDQPDEMPLNATSEEDIRKWLMGHANLSEKNEKEMTIVQTAAKKNGGWLSYMWGSVFGSKIPENGGIDVGAADSKYENKDYHSLQTEIEFLRVRVAEIEQLKQTLATLSYMMNSQSQGSSFFGMAQAAMENNITQVQSQDQGTEGGPPPPPPPPLPIAGQKIVLTNRIASTPGPMTESELRGKLKELLLGCEQDLSSSLADEAVNLYVRKFPAKHMSKLEMIVKFYPTLVKTCPLDPAQAYKRMRIWEKHLFEKLDISASTRWRKKKEYEIGKLAEEADILSEIEKIEKGIKKEQDIEKEKEVMKRLNDAKGNMIEELIKKTNMLKAQKEQDQHEKMKTAIKNAADNPIDFDD